MRLTNQPDPITRWGKSLLTFDEFADRWKSSDTPFVILVKEKNLRRFGTARRRGSPKDLRCTTNI